MHGMLSFLHTFSSVKSYLPDFHPKKLLLDSAMYTIPIYKYYKTERIHPLIDLMKTNHKNYKYKDTFTIDPNGIPCCKLGLRIHHDGYETKKNKY